MKITYAVAQIQSERNHIEKNLEKHMKYIELAAEKKAQFILFPELSLIGYERELAASQSFEPDDFRLKVLQQAAVEQQIIISAGGPLRLADKLFIASFLFTPEGKQLIYIKKYLHPGEELFFQSREDYNPILELQKERLSFAICYDIENAGHIEAAVNRSASVYTASIFYSEAGISSGLERLQVIARQYRIPVLMSNYCGSCWDMKAGGHSTIWSETGEIVIAAEKDQECLLVAEQTESGWSGMLY